MVHLYGQGCLEWLSKPKVNSHPIHRAWPIRHRHHQMQWRHREVALMTMTLIGRTFASMALPISHLLEMLFRVLVLELVLL
jgi:hypothetical protein